MKTYANVPEVRFRKTLMFLQNSDVAPRTILDLGEPNELSQRMEGLGYDVTNTDFDLDRNPQKLLGHNADVVTAFEILEHLLNPLSVLENIQSERLFATVPLRVWYRGAHHNPNNPRARHFHEFEDWQFDWLLEHAGWQIVRVEKWTNPIGKSPFKRLVRQFTPRYYAVEAKRNSGGIRLTQGEQPNSGL